MVEGPFALLLKLPVVVVIIRIERLKEWHGARNDWSVAARPLWFKDRNLHESHVPIHYEKNPPRSVVAAVPGFAPQSSTYTSIIIIMIVKELVVFKLNDFSSSADIYKRRPPLFVFRAAVISYYWAVSRPCSSCNAGTNVNHHRHHRPRRLRRRLEWWCRRGGRKTCMKPIWMDWRFIGRRSGSSGDHH